MKKLLVILFVLFLPLVSLSQGLGDDYKTVFNKVKNTEKFSNVTFNATDDRRWINAEGKLGWCSYGFALDGEDYCNVVILIPYTVETATDLIKYNNANLVVMDTNNWNLYRQDGAIVRISLKSIDNNLTFYYYFIKL